MLICPQMANSDVEMRADGVLFIIYDGVFWRSWLVHRAHFPWHVELLAWRVEITLVTGIWIVHYHLVDVII